MLPFFDALDLLQCFSISSDRCDLIICSNDDERGRTDGWMDGRMDGWRLEVIAAHADIKDGCSQRPSAH